MLTALMVILGIIWLCNVEVDVDATKDYVRSVDRRQIYDLAWGLIVRIIFLTIVALLAWYI